MMTSLLLLCALGLLGQSQTDGSEPLDFLSASVVGGANGTVYVNGAWRIPAGSLEPEHLPKTLTGKLFSDGESIFSRAPGRDEIRLVRETPEGLVADRLAVRIPAAWRDCPFGVAPAGCAKSFAARAKFVFLDSAKRHVYGLAADGTDLGLLVDASAIHLRAHCELIGVGFLAETGDILIGSGYLEGVFHTHRFGPDGRQVEDARWPLKVAGETYAVANGITWGLSFTAKEVSCDVARQQTFGPWRLYDYDSIAWTGKGYWFGTSRGAEYYEPSDPTRCLKRLGGAGEVTSLALLDGCVFATVGSRICMHYLDDLPDEPMASDDRQHYWRFARLRRDGKVVGVTKRDGRLVYGFKPDDGPVETWAFDPRITDWTHHEERFRRLDEPPPPMDPTAAAEGRWSVRYDAVRKGIVRICQGKEEK